MWAGMPQAYVEVRRQLCRLCSLINLYVGSMNQTQLTSLVRHGLKFLYVHNT